MKSLLAGMIDERRAALESLLAKLSERDRRALRLALPLMAAIVFFGVLFSLLDAQKAAATRLQAAMTLEAELPAVLPRLRSLGVAPLSATSPAGLTSETLPNGELRSLARDVELLELLRYLAQLEQSGGDLVYLRLEKAAAGQVNGEIRQRPQR